MSGVSRFHERGGVWRYSKKEKLKPLLLAAVQHQAVDGGEGNGKAFVVNVSAMEGKFYRFKTPNHPHTNMAKAALNMMTKTSAAALAESFVYMTSVDTGWVNDEKPIHLAADHASKHNFQTPIDEIDAASRILDPVFGGHDPPLHGVFLKDYEETEW